MTYTKHEDNPEKKEIIVYGLKRVKADKIENSILIGRESDQLLEIDKLFNLWSNYL